MKDFLLKLLANRLNGKKTYIGISGKALLGVGAMISGIVGLIGNMYPDLGLPSMDAEIGIATISGGFYACTDAFKDIGQEHKRIKESVK